MPTASPFPPVTDERRLEAFVTIVKMIDKDPDGPVGRAANAAWQAEKRAHAEAHYGRRAVGTVTRQYKPVREPVGYKLQRWTTNIGLGILAMCIGFGLLMLALFLLVLIGSLL